MARYMEKFCEVTSPSNKVIGVHTLNFKTNFEFLLSQKNFLETPQFLRATAVPAGTAEVRISYGNSVRLSVCHDSVVYQAQVR